MLKKPTVVFNRLLDRISEMPVVDCHEHLRGPARDLGAAPSEPIQFLMTMYLVSDLWSARAEDREIQLLQNREATTDQKWPVFSRLWAATEHTAYARVTKLFLRQVLGIERLTRQSLDHVAEYLRARDATQYMQTLRGAGIRAIVADVLYPPQWERMIRYYRSPEMQDFLQGRFPLPPEWHPVFPLPFYHELRLHDFIDYVGALTDSSITSLEEYEEVTFTLIQRCKELGIVALKDQSAYRRVIGYDLPSRSEAEGIFNELLVDPRNQLAWPACKPLDDYLFHQFMRFARELDLPVQIHTGHVAHGRNRVDKTNASHLAAVLELHTRVPFDLFHGNWPYMGDLLFLGKSYPNVSLDLCWVHMIDPLYAQELLERAVMTVPHVKIHGFGGDYFEAPEFSVAHLQIAREVIAAALANLVECGWLTEEEAVGLAADWLYNNPNEFYHLGLPPYTV